MAIPDKVRGTAVLIRIRIRQKIWSPEKDVDPENGVKITITDPSEDIVISAAGATKDSTGKYSYVFQSTVADHELGIHTVLAHADGTTYEGYQKSQFKLVSQS